MTIELRWRRLTSRPGAVTALTWAPVLIAVVYGVLLLAKLPGLVHAIYLSADVASAPYLGALYAGAPAGAHVVLGNIAWFPALFFELATRPLPGHRQLWELAPYALSLAGIGTVAWCAGRVAGRWAGATVAATLFAASPALIGWQFGWSIHAVSYAVVAALGAFLIGCVRSGGQIGTRWGHLALVVATGALGAVGFAADDLVAVAGLLPMLASVIAVALVTSGPERRRVSASVGGVLMISVIGSVVLDHLVADAHIASAPFTVLLAGFDQLVSHLQLLAQGFTYTFYGDFGGLEPSFLSAVKFGCAIVVLTAVAAGWRVARGCVRDAVAARHTPPSITDFVRESFVFFWGCVALFSSLAFMLTTVPVDQTSGRYLVPAAYGLVALAVTAAGPALPRRLAVAAAGPALPRRLAVAAGCATVCFGATLGLGRGELQANPSRFPDLGTGHALQSFVRQAHLSYGYTGYWDASALTWETRLKVRLYPVQACGTTLCPFQFHQISSFYAPRARTRSFLLSDPSQPLNPGPAAALGPPLRTVQIGAVTVYVYGYDIAARFG